MHLLKYVLSALVVIVVVAFVVQPVLLNQLSGSLAVYFSSQRPPEFAREDAFSVFPDPVGKGCEITFTARWRDTGDKTRMLVCRRNELKGGASMLQHCSSGAWCSTDPTTTPGASYFETTKCTATAPTMYSGMMDYYVFVCDQHNLCTTLTKHGRFEIVDNGKPVLHTISLSANTIGPGEELEFTATWTDPNGRDSVKLVVCSEESTACSADSILCESEYSISSPVSCTYTAPGNTPPEGKQYYAYVCDAACGTCSKITPSTSGTFGLNTMPTITTVSAEPRSAGPGETVTFNISWSDPDGRGEAAKLWVCRRNSFDASIKACTGRSADTWCKPGLGTAYSYDPVLSCQATVPRSEGGGKKYYYAFICDDEGLCSVNYGAHTGTLTILSPYS